MPWCPICKNEYPAGCETCQSCGNKLVAIDPNVANVTSDHVREQTARGCSQLPITWGIGGFGILCALVVGSLLAKTPLVLATSLAFLVYFLLLFGGGYLLESQLTIRYVWIAWGIAGLFAYLILSYIASKTDYPGGPVQFAFVLLLLLPSLGAVLVSGGIKFRQLKHWAYIALPTIYAGGVAIWLYRTGM